MEPLIIDASTSIFGRLCSFIAKKALEGNNVVVVNCNNAQITGDRKQVIAKYIKFKQKGARSLKGPKLPKTSIGIIKKGIKGMLPNIRRGIGKEAFSKIRCYNGIPKEFEGKDLINIKTKTGFEFTTIKEIKDSL
jgi:large subunit ribosomal protein L13